MLMHTHEARLDALRKELTRRGLDGFVIPISDEHMSEYVGAYAQRLGWLNGFGGSAGTGMVMKDRAIMFVDGRYTIQVREQVDGQFWEYENVPSTSIPEWLKANAPEGTKLGYDAWLHGRDWANSVEAVLTAKGGQLIPTDGNPLDAVWQDQPAASSAVAVPYDDELAGKSSAAKRGDIGEWLKAEGLDATVVSALDSVAWLLNVRGSDVDNTPVALSFVIAHADGTAEMFIAPEKVTPELTAHLGNAVKVRNRDDFVPTLRAMKDKRVAVDPERSVAAVFAALDEAGATIVTTRDPTVLPRAQKNPAEQQGHRDAQAVDGVAITKFLHWLSVEGPKGQLDELSAADRLLKFRCECGDMRDNSFDTISGAGANGASPHYKVDEESNAPLIPGSVFLCDSGGQYPAGTTDITRTVWISGEGKKANPPADIRDRFTRVLQGHIALDRQIFPNGTTGGQLDVLARQFLWMDGVDYAHGTGHGVGAFLMVHEGPQRIAKPAGGQAGVNEPLRAGMICSNEPGYYKAGEYGIRIENLVLIEPREIAGSDGEYLGFETLTLAPIARNMVEASMLSRAEKAWWNNYHAKVEEVLAPQMEGEALAFLKDACAPL